MYNACRNVTDSPPSRRYPVTLMVISTTSKPNANNSRLRSAIASPPPFVDQVSNQTAPTSLVARAQPHTAIPVVVLAEQKTVPPMRIVLELRVTTKARTLPCGIAFEDTDHPICSLFCHRARSDGMSATPTGTHSRRRAKRLIEPAKRVNQEVRRGKPNRSTPV